ncbi:MAG: zinc ribbon domain-containing protein [Desulfobacterales bacterium]
MPIYEFRCLNCQECIEILVMNNQETIEMKCPKCSSEDLERILSCSNFSTGGGTNAKPGVNTTTRTCTGGSCTTFDIPGPTR